jgi:hypothetical protein
MAGVQIVKLAVVDFLYSPVISPLSDPRILLSALFSNTLIMCSALNARERMRKEAAAGYFNVIFNNLPR